MLRLVTVWGLLLTPICALFAQSTTGEILGVVQDSSGAVVAEARVEVKNLDTNATKEAATARDGTFRFPLLPSGRYEVMVEKSGFAQYR